MLSCICVQLCRLRLYCSGNQLLGFNDQSALRNMQLPSLDSSPISRTNDEAVLCRQYTNHGIKIHFCYYLSRSLDQRGLLIDTFVRLFKHAESHPVSPLMQRGSFIRTRVIDNYLLGLGSDCQVIVLGAGHDTRWFRLHNQLPHVQKYIEIDLEEVTISKKHHLHSTDAFADPKYQLISGDLTSCGGWFDILKMNLATCIPIILIAECTLMYLPPDTLSHFKKLLIDNGYALGGGIIFDILSYGADDHFANLMIDNFATHGILIHPTQQANHDVYYLSSVDELREAGLLNESDVDIIGRELSLDEYEEWNLIGKHYYFQKIK